MGVYPEARKFIEELEFSSKSARKKLKGIKEYQKKVGRRMDDETKRFIENQIEMAKILVDAEAIPW